MTAPELSDRDREAIEAALAESGNLYMNMDARDCERLYLAGLLAGRERQRTTDEAIVRRYLQYDSQCAVSWHEVQDCCDAIRKGQP